MKKVFALVAVLLLPAFASVAQPCGQQRQGPLARIVGAVKENRAERRAERGHSGPVGITTVRPLVGAGFVLGAASGGCANGACPAVPRR